MLGAYPRRISGRYLRGRRVSQFSVEELQLHEGIERGVGATFVRWCELKGVPCEIDGPGARRLNLLVGIFVRPMTDIGMIC